jgi:hypothetical protein
MAPVNLRALIEDVAGVSELFGGMPEIAFPGVRLTGSPDAGAFRLEAEARGEDDLKSLDLPLFTPEFVGLVIERGPSAPPSSQPSVRLRLVGSIELAREAQAIDLTFELTPDGAWSASGAASPFSIRGPAGIEVTVTPRRVFLIPGETRGLELDMSAAVALKGLPDAIQRAISPSAFADVSLTGGGLKIIARSVFETIGVAIPPLEIPGRDAPIPIGELLLSANNLTLSVDREVSFSVDLGLGLPPELNRIFGRGPLGVQLGDVFETYNPERPAPNLALRVTARANDIEVRLLTSPIKTLKLQKRPDGHLGADVKLGSYGEISFSMPAFHLDWATRSLVAEGRFSHRNLRLPLAPVVELLKAGGMSRFADKIPRSIPIEPIGLAGAASTLAHLLKEALGARLVEDFAEVFAEEELSRLLDRVDALPERLREALVSIEIPGDFAYRIELTPDLSARVFVAAAPPPPKTREPHATYDIADRRTPLKLLLPILGPTGPEILRLTLYSLALGQLFAGQIVTLEVDAEIDHFKLAPIALALTLSGADLLPRPEDLTLRIGCRDLLSVLVFPGGVPVPIPLFFKEVSFVSRRLDGLSIESRWELPAPSFLPHLARCVAAWKDVAPEAPPRDLPDELRVALTVGPNFVRLPDYLGGQILGSQTKGPVIDATPAVARVIASLRTLALNELLACIPKGAGAQEIEIELARLLAS